MCSKTPFPTRQKAHYALRGILSRGKRMRAYKCPDCYKYHLTSQVNQFKSLTPPH